MKMKNSPAVFVINVSFLSQHFRPGSLALSVVCRSTVIPSRMTAESLKLQ